MWSVIKLFNTIGTIFWKYKNAFNLDFADIGGHALEWHILRPFYISSMVRSLSGRPGTIQVLNQTVQRFLTESTLLKTIELCWTRSYINFIISEIGDDNFVDNSPFKNFGIENMVRRVPNPLYTRNTSGTNQGLTDQLPVQSLLSPCIGEIRSFRFIHCRPIFIFFEFQDITLPIKFWKIFYILIFVYHDVKSN